MQYQVIVGNVGTVYSGPSKRMARREYTAYVRISKAGVGRAGDENVTLMTDEDILDEFSALDWRIAKQDRKLAKMRDMVSKLQHEIRIAEHALALLVEQTEG